ncbi:MAG: hypothetical protein WCK96_03840 [Methylococcales bacterium]
MKTKHTFLATASFPLSNKNRLRQFIRLALVGSVLVSNMASAVLQDHGPSDPTLTWPLWYRDTNGLALSKCQSTSAFCFPLISDPNGFPGNIGPEIFYNLVEFKGAVGTPTGTGSDFEYRYLGALEASYIPGPNPTHGQETVFARIRITFNFNDVNKNGDYVVTHPFGVHTFPNVQATTQTNLIGAQAANFFTVDVPLAVTGNFALALGGPVGPFIQWDTDQATLVSAAGEQFVGDPTVAHTFTGSPFGTNFLEIKGPPGSNLDGLAPVDPVTLKAAASIHDTLHFDLGNVLGQKWTQPIAEPLKIDAATLTRTTGATGINGIDIWATSSANQRVIATAPGMPSLQLIADGTTLGKYHGHIEYPSAQAVPAQVTITNLTSNPVNSISAGLEDDVQITRATFGTTSRQLTVVASSTDHVVPPALTVQGVPGVAAGIMSTAACAGVTPVVADPVNDFCYTTLLPAAIEQPESISVVSTELGHHVHHVISSPDTLVVTAAPATPTAVGAGLNAAGNGVAVSWTDNSNNETNFTVFRSDNGGAFAQVGTVPSSAAQTTATGGTVTFNDTTAGLAVGGTYTYYVVANKTTAAFSSANSTTATYTIAAPVVNAPSTPTFTVASGVATVRWVDNSTNENSFTVTRTDTNASTGAVAVTTSIIASTTGAATGGVKTTQSTLTVGHTYTFSVVANKTSAFVATSPSATSALLSYIRPAAPTVSAPIMSRIATTTNDQAVLNWIDNATTETGYTITYSATVGGVPVNGTVTLPANSITRTISPLPRGANNLTAAQRPLYTFNVTATDSTTGLSSTVATVTGRAQ